MNNKIVENHAKYLERKAQYKQFGYDVDTEREFILKQAEPIAGRILECGTGKGHFSLALAKAGHSFVTFDISPEEQLFAQMNLAYFGFDGHADFRIENAEKTSFADASFDVVFSVNVLHHLHNAYKVLDECVRIVSDNGKLILADFTQKGFDIMDAIHALEGSTHEKRPVGIPEAEAYLVTKGFLVNKASSVYQHVLISRKTRGVI